MIAILTDQNPSQKARGGHTALNQGRSNRCGRDRFAMPAGILGADMAMYGELGRLDVELIGHILTDLNLFMTAAPTGAGLKIVAMLNDGKMRGEWLPSCAISRFALLPFADI